MAETQTQTTTPPAHGAENLERGGPAPVDDGLVRAEPLLDAPRADEDLRFPGCRRIPLLRDRLTDYDGRLEYWEGRSETAWVLAEPTGGIHEGTSRRLPHLVERIAMMRGAPIASFGSVDLLVRDAGGQPARMMQADETLYLHPRRALTPEGSLVIGEHDLPDVVLEVDHTTDVRPGKLLLLYEAWGFPELWVVVPPEGARRRRPAASDDPPAHRGTLPDRGSEQGVSGLDGGGDLRWPDAVGDGADLSGAGARGAGAGRTGGHGAGRRSDVARVR